MRQTTGNLNLSATIANAGIKARFVFNFAAAPITSKYPQPSEVNYRSPIMTYYFRMHN
jgi:hypothetical protein